MQVPFGALCAGGPQKNGRGLDEASWCHILPLSSALIFIDTLDPTITPIYDIATNVEDWAPDWNAQHRLEGKLHFTDTSDPRWSEGMEGIRIEHGTTNTSCMNRESDIIAHLREL